MRNSGTIRRKWANPFSGNLLASTRTSTETFSKWWILQPSSLYPVLEAEGRRPGFGKLVVSPAVGQYELSSVSLQCHLWWVGLGLTVYPSALVPCLLLYEISSPVCPGDELRLRESKTLLSQDWRYAKQLQAVCWVAPRSCALFLIGWVLCSVWSSWVLPKLWSYLVAFFLVLKFPCVSWLLYNVLFT